jgi:hypothetical protein
MKNGCVYLSEQWRVGVFFHKPLDTDIVNISLIQLLISDSCPKILLQVAKFTFAQHHARGGINLGPTWNLQNRDGTIIMLN